MPSPSHPDDDKTFDELALLVRRQSAAQRRLATCLFATMLYRWIAGWEEEYRESEQKKSILKVIDQMHEKLNANWTVVEMAQAAQMSESTFRRAFHAETGQVPKQFYDRLRLGMARELLEHKVCNITEVSDHLGFSSPSHFGLAFRRHFGFAPSRAV